MNVEFLLAIGFGLGVSGVLSKTLQKPAGGLIGRLVIPTGSQASGKKSTALQSIALLIQRGRLRTSRKLDSVLFELPEVIDLLVVTLRAGEGIYRSFVLVVPRCEGVLAGALARVLVAVELGAAFGKEIEKVARSLPNPQVSEFIGKVVMSLERGTPLAQLLGEQSASVRDEIKNRLLRQAGKNETRMLIPLVFLILPVTVLFAIYPSLKLLNFGFI